MALWYVKDFDIFERFIGFIECSSKQDLNEAIGMRHFKFILNITLILLYLKHGLLEQIHIYFKFS